jgi:hypothetical protein
MNATIITNKHSAWQRSVRSLFLHGSLLAGGVLLAGCSGGGAGDAAAGAAAQAAQVGGKVMGGRQPVVGSTVTLYAVGSSAYGQATALTPTATTGSDGSWSISFSCPAAGTQIYAVVTGGNAGGGGVNGNLALSAVLGPCGESSTPLPTNANISEVTTVASAYALAQFLDSTGKLPGAPASNATGLSNAVGTLANLVDVSSGQAQTTLVSGASGTPPAAALNTLANLLASCVNTTGGTAGDSSACGKLFTDATPPGGTAPTTTLQAVLDIALNPGNNAAALYSLTTSNGPYQTPAPLAAAPNDWTIAVSFTITGVNALGAINPIAIDALGNPWLAASVTSSAINGGNGEVVELTPQGAVQNTAVDGGAIDNPNSIAVDGSGNVWVANNVSASTLNSGQGSVSGLNSGGGSLSGSPFTTANMDSPSQVATDASGNVWVYDTPNTNFTKLVESSAYAGTDFGAFDGTAPTGLAIDGSSDAWVTSGGDLYESSNSGAQIGSTYTGNGLSAQNNGIAIDPSNNVWIVNGNATVSEYVKASSYAATVYNSSVLNANGPFAIDSAGNLWIPNVVGRGTYGLLVIGNGGAAVSGTSANGMYTANGAITKSPAGPAIDASGNLWVGSNVNGSKVVEFVGVAKPVKTPLIGAPQLP